MNIHDRADDEAIRLLKRMAPALKRIIKHERHGDGDGGRSTYPRELKLVEAARAIVKRYEAKL